MKEEKFNSDNMKKLIPILVAILLATPSLAVATDLSIYRPRMREVYITSSVDMNCDLYQRRFISWQDYEFTMNFDLVAGNTFVITTDNLMNIERDMKFVCSDANGNMISTNSYYLIGGFSQTSTVTVTNYVTTTMTETQTNTVTNTETTTVSGGTITTTVTLPASTTTTTKTVTSTVTTTASCCLQNGQICEHDSDCCSDNCKWNQGHFHWECHS